MCSPMPDVSDEEWEEVNRLATEHFAIEEAASMDEVKKNYHWLFGSELLKAIRETNILDMSLAQSCSIDISNEVFVLISVTFPIAREQWQTISDVLGRDA